MLSARWTDEAHVSDAAEPQVRGVWEIDPLGLFRTRVAGVRSDVTSILVSEAARGELRFVDEGIDLFAGGVWLASIWEPQSRSMLAIVCAQGRFDTWRVSLNPLKPVSPARILGWPSDDFEAELRAAAVTLKMDSLDRDGLDAVPLPEWPTTREEFA